ncbi:uncharacterized protein LOC129717495 [Wyeomyia smithii]|uniref:uncharacterized protein LOC129717495 n=1 Tax=Wyeomyia smithii TaxID=174621 RepID=UPI0024680533|nr:uncharacterized protein LOC129717495 [Wyeomyia smithii]
MRTILKTICFVILFFEITTEQTVDRKFPTCDLDLDDEALQYLDKECHNLTPEARQLMLQEAASFKQFHQKLTEYESRGVEEDSKDWDFREQLYESAELYLCQNDSETQQAFVDCVVKKRNEMIVLIDEKLNDE